MKLMELPGGDTLHHYKKSLVLCFAGPRDVLSTGPIGGGFRTDLQAFSITIAIRAPVCPVNSGLILTKNI